MNTAYKPRFASPYQVAKPSTKVKSSESPIQEEIARCTGTYNLSATFEEDKETKKVFDHVHGLVSFLCTLRNGEKVIGQGRGTSVISRANRFVERNVRFSANASLIDAIVRSTKILDTFYPDVEVQAQNQNYEFVAITEKQKKYLFELIQTNIADEEERKKIEGQLDSLSKEEASSAIQRFTEK